VPVARVTGKREHECLFERKGQRQKKKIRGDREIAPSKTLCGLYRRTQTPNWRAATRKKALSKGDSRGIQNKAGAPRALLGLGREPREKGIRFSRAKRFKSLTLPWRKEGSGHFPPCQRSRIQPKGIGRLELQLIKYPLKLSSKEAARKWYKWSPNRLEKRNLNQAVAATTPINEAFWRKDETFGSVGRNDTGSRRALTAGTCASGVRVTDKKRSRTRWK